MKLLRGSGILLQYMLLGAALPLCFALFVQYTLHYPPCHFCIYQRYPYIFILFLMLISLVGLRYKEWVQLQALFAVIAWLITSGLGFYHFGIEQGVISYSGECVSGVVTSTSIDDLKKQIEDAPIVACNETGWEFLGVSMPFWNGVTGMALAVGMLYLLRYQRRHP